MNLTFEGLVTTKLRITATIYLSGNTFSCLVTIVCLITAKFTASIHDTNSKNKYI